MIKFVKTLLISGVLFYPFSGYACSPAPSPPLDVAAEYAAIQNKFASWDVNSDKRVTAEEYQKGIAKQKTDYTPAVFGYLDRNGDKSISVYELLYFTKSRYPQFAAADKNNDRLLSFSEYEVMLPPSPIGQGGGCEPIYAPNYKEEHQKFLQTSFANQDTNKDNALSWLEFIHTESTDENVVRNFSSRDQNKDEVLELKELEDMRFFVAPGKVEANSAMTKNYFTRRDANGDGKITWTEEQQHDQSRDIAFSAIDRDPVDNYLEEKEWDAIKKLILARDDKIHMGSEPASDVSLHFPELYYLFDFQSIDTNHDQKISWEEFSAAGKN